MPSNEAIRHILKNSMGITTCIWYKNGLFMSMLDDENKWGPPFLLSDNATGDYSALLDSGDNICTCFVDYAGRLLYLTACEEKKEPMVLLESRISGTAPYNICLVEADGFCHVFYTVSHNRKQLLTYQRIEHGGYSMPEVEGIIIREGKNYAVCTDDSAIHLFFVTDVQNVSLLVHRKICDGKASKPVTTPFPYSASLRLQAVHAQGGPLYVLASPDDGQDVSVLFKFDPILNKFSKGLQVYTQASGQGTDSLLLINNQPFVVRSLKSAFNLARVKVDCSAVAEEIRVDLTGRDIPLKCKFQSNHKEDRLFKCDLTPMLFGNGLRFPFDIKTLSQQKPEKADEGKDALNERIKELESRIIFLENTLREMLRP
jgi:hypothetical protein